ncbi:MAG TPA: phytanoyl-CoA dioxygenase family protein [Allosphingosinicella sp.]|jgi:hypothetical protein
MQLSRDGAQLHAGALTPDHLDKLEQALAGVPAGRPGTRLSGIPALAELLLADGPIGPIPASILGDRARPVRALLFNKTEAQNWALGWHQDRTIAVRERVETPGFANWTVKSGMLHVEPPFELLERMLTVRVHLDPVSEANAPLIVAPGSHSLGKIPEAEIALTVQRLGTLTCLAERGDIWLYATPILHASEAAAEPAARRVLQVDYSADQLAGMLEWDGF